jgi:hypothetical protein
LFSILLMVHLFNSILPIDPCLPQSWMFLKCMNFNKIPYDPIIPLLPSWFPHLSSDQRRSDRIFLPP